MNELERLIQENEVLLKENKSLRNQINRLDLLLLRTKAELFDVEKKYGRVAQSGNRYSTEWGVSGEVYDLSRDEYGDYYDNFMGMSFSEEMGLYEAGEPVSGNTEKKQSKEVSNPRLTREQEQKIVRFLKRKKCIQVTQKLRDSIHKRFGVQFTDKGIRDLMKRNGIYKRGE